MVNAFEFGFVLGQAEKNVIFVAREFFLVFWWHQKCGSRMGKLCQCKSDIIKIMCEARSRNWSMKSNFFRPNATNNGTNFYSPIPPVLEDDFLYCNENTSGTRPKRQITALTIFSAQSHEPENSRKCHPLNQTTGTHFGEMGALISNRNHRKHQHITSIIILIQSLHINFPAISLLNGVYNLQLFSKDGKQH